MNIKLPGLLLFCCLLALPQKAHPSNLVGAELTYKHQGNGYYTIILVQYNNSLGTGAPNSRSICITSSCEADQIVILPGTPHPVYTDIDANGDTIALPFGGDIPDQYMCANPANSGLGPVQVHTYQKTVHLNPCANWIISTALSPRTSSMTNAINTSSIYIEAKLNNQNGHNSAPQFKKPGFQRFCELNLSTPNSFPFKWDQSVIEADGDSLYYRLAQPKTGLCDAPEDVPWAAGYSVQDPVHTSNGILIDQTCGIFTFRPLEYGLFLVAFDVEEYRFNYAALRWEKVGSVSRDIMIPIDRSCLSSVIYGPQVDINKAGYDERTVTSDSLKRYLKSYLGGADTTVYPISNPYALDSFKLPIIPYQCNSNSLILDFNTPIFCPSIHPTDFRLAGPDGKSRPITRVVSDCAQDCGASPRLKLHIDQPLDVNGEYLLYIKTGNDGNTLENSCGFGITPNYYMILKVHDCPTLDYSIQKVSVLNDESIEIGFQLDSMSYIRENFSHIAVLRANNNQNFYHVGNITDQHQRSFLDTTLDMWAVDNQIYQYRLQLHTAANPRVPTNMVNSIVLKADSIVDNTIQFSWNPYLNNTYGGTPAYELFSGTYDPLRRIWNWTSIKALANVNSYTYLSRINRPGPVWYKIEATDASGLNTTVAESNYLCIGKPQPPGPPPPTPFVNYIPNLITPNNDNQNDRFYFQFIPTEGKRPYSNLSLSIYNRWGKQVFKSDNFMERNTEEAGWDGTDQYSGNKVADGVYFYVALFTDIQTGKSEEINGSVTVSRGK